MSNTNDTAEIKLFFIAVAIAIIAFLVWRFSKALGVDMNTGGGILISLAASISLILSGHFNNGFGFFTVRGIWPVALAVAFAGLWPAMDVWAAPDAPLWAYEPSSVWWVSWWAKLSGVILILVCGYSANKFFDQ